jgi:hypothetical protein
MPYQVQNAQINKNAKNIQSNQLIYAQNNIQHQNNNTQINALPAQNHRTPQVQNLYQQQQPQIQPHNQIHYLNYNNQIKAQQQQPQIQAKTNLQIQQPQYPAKTNIQMQQPQVQAKTNTQIQQPQYPAKTNIQIQPQYKNQNIPYTQIPQVQPGQQKLPQYYPKLQQNLPQQQQKVPYQMLPNQQINQKQQPNLQPQPQPQTTILSPNQILYQQQIQNGKNINPNEKLKIEYNKNNEHFVNKPIYPETTPMVNPATYQQPQIKNPTNLNNNNIVPQNNIVNEAKKKSDKILEKYGDPKLSTIEEEEIDIRQSGLSKKISKLDSSEIVKETPIEEKKPETVLPDNIVGETNQKKITEKSITESGISDFEANMSHLPTINSIMKGTSEPLPPSKKNKYGK